MQTSTTAITLNLPDVLYQKIQRLAQTFRRPMEEVLLDAVATALPPLTGLPLRLADELADLAFLNDAELWQIVRSTLPIEHYQQVDNLLAMKGQGRLTEGDQQALDRLLKELKLMPSIRAPKLLLHFLTLAHKTGHNISYGAMMVRRSLG